MSGPNKVVQSSRQVIQHKLLTALEEEDTVAILANKEDLDLLIRALCFVPLGKDPAQQERVHSWLAGMRQLRKESFGE